MAGRGAAGRGGGGGGGGAAEEEEAGRRRRRRRRRRRNGGEERLAKVPKTVRLAVVSGFLRGPDRRLLAFLLQAGPGTAPWLVLRRRCSTRSTTHAPSLRTFRHRGGDRGNGARPRARPEASRSQAIRGSAAGHQRRGKISVTSNRSNAPRKSRDFLARCPSSSRSRLVPRSRAVLRNGGVAAAHREHRQPRHPGLEGDPGVDAFKVAGKARTYRFLANEA